MVSANPVSAVTVICILLSMFKISLSSTDGSISGSGSVKGSVKGSLSISGSPDQARYSRQQLSLGVEASNLLSSESRSTINLITPKRDNGLYACIKKDLTLMGVRNINVIEIDEEEEEEEEEDKGEDGVCSGVEAMSAGSTLASSQLILTL